MSPKRKSGLQRGLGEIVARQTAQTEEKARQSADLISKFAEPKTVPPSGIPSQGIPSDGIPAHAIALAEKRESGPSLKLAELVREERGYYPTFNDISDRLIPELKLDAYEQVVLLRLYRLSRGWQKDSCVIGHTKLAKNTNLSRSTVQKTIARLVEKELIVNLGDRGNDGTEYRILPGVAVLQRGIPSGGIPPGERGGSSHGTRRSDGIPPDGYNKNKEGFTDKDKKKPVRLTPEEIQSFATTIANLMGEGKPLEEIETRFASNMHPVDWATVKSVAQAQAAPKRMGK